jgi:acetyl-CoA carboxylase carboxyltransferase component
LAISREIVSRLNHTKTITPTVAKSVEPPKFATDQLYGIVGANLKKSYDIREVNKIKLLILEYLLLSYGLFTVKEFQFMF